MENLIPLINRLQDTFASVGMTGLDLPQIAVIGSQSSGKSSVLESIVGRDFLPRGSGIVTRRPLVLQLINNSTTSSSSSIVSSSIGGSGSKPAAISGGKEYGVFLHDSTGKQYTDFHRIRDEIVAETDRVTGTNKGISSLPINLKIYSPRVVNLTLIDLPGITKIAVGDQPEDIEQQIMEMVMQFIQQESCLILAVTPANSDLANSDALQLAKRVDPEGFRTIGVLTKLDLMDEGTDCLAILQNKVYPLRHGYVGVVNRSQRDIDQQRDVNSALNKEKQWFESHPVYSGIKSTCGTAYLQQRLRSILISHIQQHLPGLKSRLSGRLQSIEQELSLIDAPFAQLSLSGMVGDSSSSSSSSSLLISDGSSHSQRRVSSSTLNSPERLQAGLINIIRIFGATVKQLIDGHDGDLFGDAFNVLGLIAGNAGLTTSGSNQQQQQLQRRGDRHLNIQELSGTVRIKYIFQNIFPDALIDLESVLLSSCMDNEIRTIIYNVRGLSTGLFIPDAVFELLIKRHIMKLEAPALECIDRVHDELLRLIKQLLEGPTSPVRAFPLLLDWMMSETLRILDECKQPTVQEVKRLIMMEMGYINCGHPDFLGKNGITEWVISQRSRLEDDRQQLRSPNSGRRSPMSAVMSNMLRATNRELAAGRKEGYLTKLGGMHKTWKKRYFILRDTTVIFYEKQGDKNVKGQFQLDHCLVRDVDRNAIYPQSEADAVLAAAGEENGQVFKGKPFAFEIFTHDQSMLFRNHRRLYLVAESERDKEEWIAALAHGIEFSRQLTLVLQSDSSPEDSPHKQPQQQPHQENSKDAANRRAPPPPPRSKKPPVPPALNTSRSNLQPTSALPAIPIRLYATDLIGTNHDGALAPELANTGSSTPSVHNSKNGKQQSQKQQPQQLSSTDDTTIALVRALLHSYFVIVRKHIQDLVPKAIMLLMVTKIKKDLPVLLTNKVLCGGDKRFNVCDLMQESEQVREERRLKMDMCRLVREALHVIEHEVRKEMV